MVFMGSGKYGFLLSGIGALLVAVLATLVPSAAWAEDVPASLQGTWSTNCHDPAAVRIVLGAETVSIVVNGQRHDYAGVSVSRTWHGGARATGDRIWFPTSKTPGQAFEFVVAVTPGEQGVLVLEEGHPQYGRDVRSLFGSNFRRCGGDTAQDTRAEAPSQADGDGELDVAVMEHGGDGQMANCASSMVTGLKADGDGFLAVRSGPGTGYRKIDELHNGDIVMVFEQRGNWAGVVYRTPNVTCSATETRAVPYENKGWVHTNWLKDIAG